MKNIKITFAALAAAVLLTGCTSDSTGSDNSSQDSVSVEQSASVSERTASVLEAVELPEMVEVTAEKLAFYFSIEEGDVAEFSAYICGSGAMPDEFGVFVAADEEKAAVVKTNLEERIEKQKELFTDYTPAEMYKFDDCFVEVNGTTVIYGVTADNTTAKDMLG